MKIILSNQFIIDFENDFKKYGISYQGLVLKLKETKIINLKNPYFKIKIYINGISLRGIGIFNNKNTVVPLFFVLKKDKKFGDNLILNKVILNKINKLFERYGEDFNKGNFIEF